MKNLLLLLFSFIFLGLTQKPSEKLLTVRYYSSDTITLRESIYKNINIDLYIEQCAKSINTEPEYLYLIIQHESHHNPQAINPYTNAVGLIQFIPSTIKGMGYTVGQVYSMTYVEQLKLVEQYYSYYSNYNLNNPIKLFLCTFYPYALSVWDNDDYIFGSEGYKNPNTLAKQNKGFDLNNDGVITMKEYKEYHYLYILNL